MTLEVYNNARELVPYTFEQCPERTLVYGKNNVEIMLALGLEDKILMTADCSSVLPVSYTHLHALQGAQAILDSQDAWLYVIRKGTYEPVSYTHLVPQLLVELPHLIRFQVEDTEDRLHPVLDGYAPVSYTHLDVYKRQPI